MCLRLQNKPSPEGTQLLPSGQNGLDQVVSEGRLFTSCPRLIQISKVPSAPVSETFFFQISQKEIQAYRYIHVSLLSTTVHLNHVPETILT